MTSLSNSPSTATSTNEPPLPSSDQDYEHPHKRWKKDDIDTKTENYTDNSKKQKKEPCLNVTPCKTQEIQTNQKINTKNKSNKKDVVVVENCTKSNHSGLQNKEKEINGKVNFNDNKTFKSHLVEIPLESSTPIKENISFQSGEHKPPTPINKLEKRENNTVNSPQGKNLEETTLPSNFHPVTDVMSPKKKKISGKRFKDIVHSLCLNDFVTPYRKLNSTSPPACCDPTACEARHKTNAREVTSLSNRPLFNILDNPLSSLMRDLSAAAFTVMRPEQYFRGDVIRVLFDYVLNGPSEDVMWDVKYILTGHLELHPPCTEKMRNFYLNLLDEAYKDECYFKTDLASVGVLSYVMQQLDTCLESEKPSKSKEQGKVNSNFSQEEMTPEKSFTACLSETVTYETMEKGWNNSEPILQNEYDEVMDALDHIIEAISEKPKDGLKRAEKLMRCVVAVELIVDILEADFLICVSKLKKHMVEESDHLGVREPLIMHLVGRDLKGFVFKVYANTTHHGLWTQLSRLVGLMAESIHLFKPTQERLWQYHNLTPACFNFSTTFFNSISNCEWSEEDTLQRFQTLQPAWLQLQVVMRWINSRLNVLMGNDLKSLVEIIHMHVKSPIKFKKVKSQCKVNEESTNLRKRVTTRNHYGETLLHRLCKEKTSSLLEIQSVLALPETNINAKDNYGWTPLHEAVGNLSFLKVTLLLQYQPPPGRTPVDMGAQNIEGETPLHEAVSLASLQMCQLLIDYGGVCLLRKTNSKGETPLDLAKSNPEINKYFEVVIKTQELNADSILNLPDHMICLLMTACNSFLSDHHTLEVYYMMKFDEKCSKLSPIKCVLVDQSTLVKFKNDQDQFKKLRRILKKLAENVSNSPLVRLWDSKFPIITLPEPNEQEDMARSITQTDQKVPFSNASVSRMLFEEQLCLVEDHMGTSPM